MSYLTDKQVKEFNTRGFIVMKKFFSADIIEAVSDWLDELSANASGSGGEAKYYEKSAISGENVLIRVEHIMGDHNLVIQDRLINGVVTGCLEDLLGEAPVLFKEKVNYKLPGSRPDLLHQDQAAGWNAYCDFFVTMCIVVDENRRDNAALSILSSGNYEKRLMGEEWQPLSREDPPWQPEEEYTLLEADPGDVIFFDCYVPHGSPANNSTRARRNIYLTFNRQSDGDMRERYYADKWKSYPPNDAGHARSTSTYRV